VKQLTEEEKKIFRRLRSAYRRATLVVLHRKGSRDDVVEAIRRISARAVALHWLELPQEVTP
jgi:Tat protein secretion system quality control protein TatD with DNase activity